MRIGRGALKGYAVFGKHDLKWLLRSRSPQLARDRDPSHYVPGAVSSFRMRGRRMYYRPGSSDPEVIYKILLRRGAKAEYHIPERFSPGAIWDIGANIGAASLYFSECYPDAAIHCFEPVPENHAMILRNIEGLERIRAHGFAMGAKEGMLEIRASDAARNFGGFSFHDAGTAKAAGLKVQVRTPRSVIEDGTAPSPDLIKIDVEGAEYDILTAFEPGILERVGWITGELHGNRSFELLEFLTQWFDIETRKTLGKRLFNFLARNRKL
ncbi:MAG: FkbM family methyltransferase [Burkholderiales bacterium]